MYFKPTAVMPVAVPLAKATSELLKLKHWRLASYEGSACLEADFPMKDFVSTTAFVNTINMISHQRGHHPTVTYSYDKVQVVLQTHEPVQGISDIDLWMAKRFSIKANQYLKQEE